MRSVDVIVVGAGLAGLYAARLLEGAGVTSYALLDGRSRTGGRIHAFTQGHLGAAGDGDAFDLGATWLWPEFQPQLEQLIGRLGLSLVRQYDIGDMLFQRAGHDPVERYSGMQAVPPAFRIAGGMPRLLQAIQSGVAQDRVHLRTKVIKIKRDAGGVSVTATKDGMQSTWSACAVLLALPPRLAASSVEYDPPLPAQLFRQWRGTTTHMAAHAKYLAVYPADFWRTQGLSGEVRSLVGPLGEIHDASSAQHPALFGFFAYSASMRAQVPGDELKQLCRYQLARLFGSAALEPLADVIQDWSVDPFTATSNCGAISATHGQLPPSTVDQGAWSGLLIGAGSEWSASNPGYLAGAIEAATQAVEAYLSLHENLEAR